MTAALMTNLQSFPGAARLDAHTARRLSAVRRARWVWVLQGEVWLTTDGYGDQPGKDVWITAGDRWLLPAGVGVVLQGEPHAEVQLVEAELPWVSAASPGRVASAWQALRAWARRQGLIGPAPCAAC
jgi:uncharacterized protein YjlB